MRWVALSLFLFVSVSWATYTPIYSVHDTSSKVDEEFRNIEASVQTEAYEVFSTTPNLRALKDGQIIIYSTGVYSSIMWRYNQEIYAIKGSCVTVTR